MKKKCVNSADLRPANAQHLRQGRHAHQHHHRLPILVTSKFPSLWQTNRCKHCILQCSHFLMKEADREVAAICRAPEYYWVRSQVRRQPQYFMYNALDDIGGDNTTKTST